MVRAGLYQWFQFFKKIEYAGRISPPVVKAARRLYNLFEVAAGGCQRIGIEEFGDVDVGMLHFGAFDGVKGHGLLKKLLENGLQGQRKSRVSRYPIRPLPALYKSETTLETFSKPHNPFFVSGTIRRQRMLYWVRCIDISRYF